MRPMFAYTLLFAALISTACRMMSPVTLEQLNTLKPERAWVTDVNQSVVVVSRPQVVGDTLMGYVNGKFQQLPSAALKQVIVQKAAPTRTALLAIGIAGGLGGVFLAIAGNNSDGPYVTYPSSDCGKHPSIPGCP